jgi:uncharacterized protein YqgC (DUF456 family)
MELSDTGSLATVLAGMAIIAGVAGILVPLLPALPLCWAGVLIWALFGDGGWARWPVLVAATALALGGTVVKYLLPGRRLKRSGVPAGSLFSGAAFGIVGFFVIPVIGLVLGFVFGVWIAELARLGDARLAWPSTQNAVMAAGLAFLIELSAALGIAAVWMIGLVVS